MPLITRGRLSVQRVSAKCWDVIHTMADQGGWDNMSFEKKKIAKARPTTSRQRTKHAVPRDEDGDVIRDDAAKHGRKRKISTCISPEYEGQPRRRSLRNKK